VQVPASSTQLRCAKSEFPASNAAVLGIKGRAKSWLKGGRPKNADMGQQGRAELPTSGKTELLDAYILIKLIDF
jgi:hypothetical protein